MLDNNRLKQMTVTGVFYVSFLVAACYGHVVLTYPPARKYPLDFLDNVGTRGPCGMPRDSQNASFTTLSAATTVSIHWHLAYTHRGGIYLELADSSQHLVRRYPDVGWALENDVSSSTYTIQLPAAECRNCTLRLVKQATDWAPGHIFWSCADVHLVTQELSGEAKCSSRGFHNGVRCICHRTYVGDKCQFKDECVDDSDCSYRGRCTYTNSTGYPRNQCYCQAGWFGRRCEKESPVKTIPSLNEFAYKLLSPGFELYYRILQASQELEVVLKTTSVTWVGFGWRSLEATESCRQFLVKSEINEGNSESFTDPVPACTPNFPGSQPNQPPDNSACQPTENSTSPPEDGHVDPNPCDGVCDQSVGCLFRVAWTHEPGNGSLTFTLAAGLTESQYMSLGLSTDEFMPDTDIVVTWVAHDSSVYLSDRWAASKSTPAEDKHNDLTLLSGDVTAGLTTIKFSRLISPADPQDLNLSISGCVHFLTAIGDKNDTSRSIRYHRGSRAVSSQKFCFDKCPGARKKSPTRRSVTTGPEADLRRQVDNILLEKDAGLHPMDCTDLIIGSVIGNTSRIGDYYTRDRSTPLFDEVYGGVDSLTAAVGYRDSSEMLILFRRKLKSDDVTDWPVQDRPMHVVWARGQHGGDIIHHPPSAYEMNEMMDRDYYRRNELKYHGGDEHRGNTSLNFYESPSPITTITPPTQEPTQPTFQPPTQPPTQPTSQPSTQPPTQPTSQPTSQLPTQMPTQQQTQPPTKEPTQLPAQLPTQLPRCLNGGCTDPGKCPYLLKWTYDPVVDTITFLVMASVKDDQWIAIGFSENDEMPNTDVVAMYFIQDTHSGSLIPQVSDRYASDRSEPKVDATNNVKLINASRQNGVSTFLFSRPARTGDSADRDLLSDGSDCPFVFYGLGGAVSSSGVMEFHPVIPAVAGRVCFGICGTLNAGTEDTTARQRDVTTLSTLISVNCSIKVTNLKYKAEEFGDLTSAKAQEMKATLELELGKALGPEMNNLYKVNVQRFRPGSVIVDFEVVVSSGEDQRSNIKEDIKRHLQAVVEKSQLADYTLDRTYLKLDESPAEPNVVSRVNKSSAGQMNKSEIIILAVALVLCVVGVSLVTFKFCVSRRLRTTRRENCSRRKDVTSSQAESDVDLKYSELTEGSKGNQNERIFEPHYQTAYENPGYLDPETLNTSSQFV